MDITAETRVSDLLNAHPETVEVLAEFNPHFAKLRNRVLRKIMAPRVTLAQAAQIAQVEVAALLAVLARATGQAAPPHCAGPAPARTPLAAGGSRPPFLEQFTGDRLVIVDVREDIRRGQEPFAKIMAAVKELKPGQALLLRNVFEPVPLYQVLKKKELDHWTECRGPEDWWIYFYPSPAAGTAAAASSPEAGGGGEVAPVRRAAEVIVDARGLEPPQPMQRILEALASLPEGATLLARTDRRPMLLYPKLEERGYRYETRETDGDGFETRIWR
jgi:uncharacterized protein (DUF2249 family)